MVKFADLPLGIQQSILKEKIRSAVVSKVEWSSRQPLTSLTNDRCKKNHYCRVALCRLAAKESPVCEQAFKNIYSIFQRGWKSLKKLHWNQILDQYNMVMWKSGIIIKGLLLLLPRMMQIYMQSRHNSSIILLLNASMLQLKKQGMRMENEGLLSCCLFSFHW